ncbi:MAG: hypothetical protein MUC45_07370 [Actinomycetia bacterium]|nr:hypothetical protein [Actinomycetes bacterium]
MPEPADSAVDPARRERWREGVMMALYVSLSQVAVLLALPDDDVSALTVGLTSVGLLLAHRVAFQVSTRLVNQGRLDAEQAQVLGAQLVGGLVVTVIAVLPILLVDGPGGVRIAEVLLLGFVAVVSYLTARTVPTSRPRALGYAAAVLVVASAVLVVKAVAAH